MRTWIPSNAREQNLEQLLVKDGETLRAENQKSGAPLSKDFPIVGTFNCLVEQKISKDLLFEKNAQGTPYELLRASLSGKEPLSSPRTMQAADMPSKAEPSKRKVY